MFSSLEKRISKPLNNILKKHLKEHSLSIMIKENILLVIIDIKSQENNDLKAIETLCKNEIEKFHTNKKINILFTQKKNADEENKLPKIILFASAKGGVGKSTICVNTAVIMAKMGYKVAVADTDIYGPSTCHLLNIAQKEPEVKNNKMIPLENYGVKLISMGLLIAKEKALIWRAPMITKTLNNLINNTKWDSIDYLLVDTPPGTGDIHLSLAKNFKITNSIIITTPHKLAILDTIKTLDMFNKLNIPIAGLVENMSYDNNNISKFITEQKIKLLTRIPMSQEINQLGDNGLPITQSTDQIITNYKKIIKSITN